MLFKFLTGQNIFSTLNIKMGHFDSRVFTLIMYQMAFVNTVFKFQNYFLLNAARKKLMHQKELKERFSVEKKHR